MALSGSFSGSIESGHYKLQVDWSATQNITNNTSKITATMYLVNDWKLIISGRSDNSTNIAGTAQTWASPSINGTGTTKLGTVTSGDILHSTDGTKNVTISATFNVRATINGTYYEKITASANVTLNTIPRATTPTFNASSVDMGGTLTIYTSRASTSFKHDLEYSFAGGGWVPFASNVDTWYAWAVPDLATSLPNATSGTMTIRCTTKNGGTTIGTKTATVTVKVPADYVPTVESITVTEAADGLASQFGTFVQNKSRLKVNIAASGVDGSSIKSYKATLQGKTYTTANFTSDVITGYGNINIDVTVTDSRGRSSVLTRKTVTVAEYSPPKIQGLSCYRCDANGNASDNGDYAAVRLKYSVSPVNNKNTARAVCSIKKTTDPDTSYTGLFTRTNLTLDTTVKPTGATFSTDNQFTVRMEVTDWFGGAPTALTAILPSGAVILDILANGKGIAFGKTADKEGVDFGWSPKGAVLGLGEVSQFIPSNGDFNNYVTPGVYGVQTSEIAKTLDNGPDTVYAGTLRVWNATGEGRQTGAWVYIMQEYRPFYASEPTFRRLCHADASGKWSYPTSWETIGGLRNYTVTWGSDVTNKGYSLSREGGMVCFNAHVSVRADIAAGATKVIGTLPDEVLLTNTILSMGRHGTSSPISVALRPSGELVVTPTSNYSSTASIFFTLTWNTAATWN
jgi:hypothetical protein